MADSNENDAYDIRGLDPQEAKKYIVAVMATLKQTTAKRIQAEREVEIWEKRVELAVEKGREDLVPGAQQKVDQLKEDISQLRGEELEYTEGMSRMRSQLRVLQAQPTMTVDADLLAAQLDMMIGETEKEDAATEGKFRDAQADWALDDLKKRMQNENEQDS